MFKDVNIAVNTARELGLEVPLSSRGRDIWEKALAFSGNEASISEMVKYVEDKTCTRIDK